MASKRDVDHSNKFIGKIHKIAHHRLVALNLLSNLENVDSWQKLYQPFPFESSMPVPVSHPGTSKFDDPFLQYITNKEIWKRKISTMKSSYKSFSRKQKIEKLTEKSGTATVPLYLLKFTKFLREDPDKYFDCKYNWYCSGNGNLCLTTIGDKAYFLKSVSNELRCQFSTKNIEEKCRSLYVCDSDDVIYETVTAEWSENILVGLRLRDQINILSVQSDPEALTADLLLSIKSDGVPFTSVALNQSGKDFCYTHTNGSVHVQDLNTNKEFDIFENDSEFIVNNWSSVEYLNNTCILLTCGDSMRLLDKRTSLKPDAVLLPASQSCDRVTSSKLSTNKEYGAFFATTHNIYFYDWRFVQRNSFVSKWTHSLRSAPIHLSSILTDEGELVNIGSQLSNESCIILNTINNRIISENDDFDNRIEDEVPDDPIRTCVPWKPVSIHETLRQSQLRGECLNPTIDLKKRFSASTSGNILTTHNDSIVKYTLNSMGDIFHQTIRKPNLKCDDGEFDSLKAWAGTIKQEPFTFVVSGTIDTTKTCLRLLNDRSNHLRKDEQLVQKGFLQTKQSWNRSIDNLNSYSDMCANELLAMWNLNDNKGVEALASAVDTKFAVDSWMNQFALYDESFS